MSGDSELNYLARSFKRVIAKYSSSSLVLTTVDANANTLFFFFLLFSFGNIPTCVYLARAVCAIFYFMITKLIFFINILFLVSHILCEVIF